MGNIRKNKTIKTGLLQQQLKMLSNESLKEETPVGIAIIIFMYFHVKQNKCRNEGKKRTRREKANAIQNNNNRKKIGNGKPIGFMNTVVENTNGLLSK